MADDRDAGLVSASLVNALAYSLGILLLLCLLMVIVSVFSFFHVVPLVLLGCTLFLLLLLVASLDGKQAARRGLGGPRGMVPSSDRLLRQPSGEIQAICYPRDLGSLPSQ